MTREEWFAQLFTRLGNSKFRTSFHLRQKDLDYIEEKGLEVPSKEDIFERCKALRY